MTKENDLGLPSLEEVMKMVSKSKRGSEPTLDKKVEEKRPQEPVHSIQYKQGLLYVQLTDVDYFNYHYRENEVLTYYNHREVEILIHKSKEVIYLTTDTHCSLE